MTAAGYYDTSYPPSLFVPPVSATVASAAPAALVTTAGPTTITVTGTGFTASSSVRFDSVPAATAFVNPTTLTASLDPAGAARTVTVTVVGATGFAAVAITVGVEEEPEEPPAQPVPADDDEYE